MKKIGLVGGTSWTSTLGYYRIINEEVNRYLGGAHSAECLLYSLDFEDFRSCNAKHDWNGARNLLSNAANCLRRAGAECIVLCANTAHIVAEAVAADTGLPLIDIRTVTADAIRQKGLHKVGLLGTVYTMELDFYKDKLREHGIETIVPQDRGDISFIEQTLAYELGKGIITESTRQTYIRIANQLTSAGAEGLILGCTEIPLIIGQEDFTIPVFDTTRLHAEAAVAFALHHL